LSRAALVLQRLRQLRPRLIVDTERRLNRENDGAVEYPADLKKEAVARQYILGREGGGQRFLDVGARDGRLDYLLGVRENLDYDPGLYERNFALFRAKYEYWGMDLDPEEAESVIVGDVCSETLLDEHAEFRGFFDVIYSNNVFEHLRQPWVAARNLIEMLAPGGICVTIAPFSLRYHESPADYFRYTHTGLAALFEDQGPVHTIVQGYDVSGRRNDWQGLGTEADIVPVDRFGAWRENWFVVNIVEKGT
jgi:SAM-dependent methyltransferase